MIFVPQKGVHQHHQHQKQHGQGTEHRVEDDQHQDRELPEAGSLDGGCGLAESDRKEEADQDGDHDDQCGDQAEESCDRNQNHHGQNESRDQHQEGLDVFWTPDFELTL